MSRALNIITLIFDVADTLLTKGDIPAIFVDIIERDVRPLSPEEKLKLRHSYYQNKYTAQFPDLTSMDFYQEFNRRVLQSIEMDTTDIVDLICLEIKERSWLPFDDTKVLANLGHHFQLGILSNWDLTLGEKLKGIFPEVRFDPVVCSASIGIQKPDPGIFRYLIEILGQRPEQILYVGDSPRLDIEPAKKMGITTVLIDRESLHKNDVTRINSLEQLEDLLCLN